MPKRRLGDQGEVERAVRRLLEFIGEDPDRAGVKDTPRRFVEAMCELTSGLCQDAGKPLEVTFDEGYDEIVCVRDMPFVSLCEHHLLGFTGVVHFAYLPKDGRVVGLSKIPRMVEVLSRRPQVQERLTTEIASTFQRKVEPLGVAVVVEGRHSCMSCRGVRSTGTMVTSVVRGVFKDKPEARAEVMALMGVT